MGKSTIARALVTRMQIFHRHGSVLDGDIAPNRALLGPWIQ
ncbi:hypothetical protein [Paraburkholderia flagellata]